MGAYHCEGFTLCGVDFARHDTAARLVFWQIQLSKTTPWSTSQQPAHTKDASSHTPPSFYLCCGFGKR